MIYFVGIHHKGNLEALCSSTVSGRKIDQVIERIGDNCAKINLFSTSFIPDRNTRLYYLVLADFISNVENGNTLVLLGKQVQEHFPYPLYRGDKIVKFRHPAFSPPTFVNELVKILNSG